jgi:hypothetical protein
MSKHVKVSIGEYIDKITILQIKQQKMNNEHQLININRELNLLLPLDAEEIVGTKLYNDLKKVNEQLWGIEDRIRIKEKRQEFDDEFIHLARSVYKLNDQRAEIKRQINLQHASELIEEKSYE